MDATVCHGRESNLHGGDQINAMPHIATPHATRHVIITAFCTPQFERTLGALDAQLNHYQDKRTQVSMVHLYMITFYKSQPIT